MAKTGQEFEYDEVIKKVGEDAAKRGFQTTGAYYPHIEAGGTGTQVTQAFCRRIRSIVPGNSIFGEETLDNHDGDERVARLLNGRLFKLFERAFSKLASGLYHEDLSEEERWDRVDELVPLGVDGSPVPLEPNFFRKKDRYMAYPIQPGVILSIMVMCFVERNVTTEEINAIGKGSGIQKIKTMIATEGMVEAQSKLRTMPTTWGVRSWRDGGRSAISVLFSCLDLA